MVVLFVESHATLKEEEMEGSSWQDKGGQHAWQGAKWGGLFISGLRTICQVYLDD